MQFLNRRKNYFSLICRQKRTFFNSIFRWRKWNIFLGSYGLRYRVVRPVRYTNVHFKKNNIVRTISTLGKENSFDFTFKPTKFTGGWSSVIHFSTGANLSRLPALFLLNNVLYVSGYVSGNRNYNVHKAIPLNKWCRVRVVNSRVGTNYYYTVYINGQRMTRIRNTRPRSFRNVRVYVTDPWYKPFVGVIRYLHVRPSIKRVRKGKYSSFSPIFL